MFIQVSANRAIHKARSEHKKKSRYYRPPRQVCIQARCQIISHLTIFHSILHFVFIMDVKFHSQLNCIYPIQRKTEEREGRRGPRGMPGPPGPPGTCPENVCRAAVEPQFSNLLKEIATQLENEVSSSSLNQLIPRKVFH